jgi:hypothetical protein
MRLDPLAAFPSRLRAGEMRLFFAGICVISALFMSGCTPHIGDHCTLSTDCSLQGDRQCDTAEPNGYCTVFGCQGNLCPDEAACVLFNPAVPGCNYTDREPSRIAQAACMKQCSSDSDCRTDEGYICANPKGPPWNALILDDDQSQNICIPGPYVVSDVTPADASTPQVCSPDAPDGGALFTPVDGGPLPPIVIVDSGAAQDADAGDAD